MSDVGSWVGFFAAALLVSGRVGTTAASGVAVACIVVAKLLAMAVLSPAAVRLVGVLDRRLLMSVLELVRALILASIAVCALLFDSGAIVVIWTFAAILISETAGVVLTAARDTATADIVPEAKQAIAGWLTTVTSRGIAPLCAALLLGAVSRLMLTAVDDNRARLAVSPTEVTLFAAAALCLTAAVLAFTFGRLAGRVPGVAGRSPLAAGWQGWRSLRGESLARRLALGMVLAFVSAGLVLGVSVFYVSSLRGGEAAVSLAIAALLLGVPVGVVLGPRWVGALSPRRWFGMSVVAMGAAVAALAISPHLAIAVPVVFLFGASAGMVYTAGSTVIARQAGEEIGGRPLQFVRSLGPVLLGLTAVIASVLVGFTAVPVLRVGGFSVGVVTVRILLLLVGALVVLAGYFAFRRVDDKPGVPVLADLAGSVRGRPVFAADSGDHPGVFVAFEGGDGAGKSTQALKLAAWLKVIGRDYVLTREPGATPLGKQIRELLLTHGEVPPAPRAEALLYAADRAHHVDTVIRPALRRGAVVVTDRYVDSSLAYQGAGRALKVDEVAYVSAWATEGLKPDLVVLLDLAPADGLARADDRGAADRMESESLSFHQRVRQAFLDRAESDPERYMVVDASGNAEIIAEQVRDRVAVLLAARGLPVPKQDNGSDDPTMVMGAWQ